MRKKLPKILVTGGAGFIGSEFVRQAVPKGYSIIVVDKLTYAGDLARLKEVRDSIKFYKTDIVDQKALIRIFKIEKPQAVVHFAAETHVDRSLQKALPFLETNITGTQNLIDISRAFGVKKFIHISTDEVYGESIFGKFKETAPLKAKNPYSASKAAGEFLVNAAIKTYNFPAVIVRPANNYGPWQYPEKFIPVIILKALRNQQVPVYGKGKQIREWLYVSDCAAAVHLILEKGKVGEVYNIGTYFEQKNIKTAQMVLRSMDKPENLIQFVKDRAGHDFRYSVDCAKIKKLGWQPKISFKKGIKNTIQWSIQNKSWITSKC